MFGLQRLCGYLRSPPLLQCVRLHLPDLRTKSLPGPTTALPAQQTSLLSRCMATLSKIHKVGPRYKVKRTKTPLLDGCPQKRGVVLKVIIKKPKKPNSANRRCVRVRLSNGKEATAYIPGEGHNLQEHSVVLVQGGKLQDTPGVNLVCVRGKYDLAHVKRKAK